MSESNKDEALRCLAIAIRHRTNGNLAAAGKFCKKSISLYESEDALRFLQRLPEISATSTSQSEAVPRDELPKESTTGSEPLTQTRDDPERLAVVQRIRACRSTQYYEILGVARNCTELEIKKAYRKLVILTHPDKCDIPGAAEAFKMIARAWQVLGDPKLREQHDATPDVDHSFSSQPSGNARSFRGHDVTPEELFDMFFNGGFDLGAEFKPRPAFTAAFGPTGFRAYNPRRSQAQNEGNSNIPTANPPFFQILPVIILFAISFLGSLPSFASLFTTPDPGFSLSASHTYSAERLTTNYRIPYYVNPQEFLSHPIYKSIPEQYRNSPQAGPSSPMLRTFESAIERGFVSSLRAACNREFDSKEERMHRHRGILGFLGNPEMVERIHQEPMPNCQRLSEIGLISS